LLTPFSQLLAERADGTAVGAFTVYDMETTTAVLHAAVAANAGVIILIGSRSYAGRDGDLLLAAVVTAAARSEARACIQLDHCDSIELIESALTAGAGAVMADGSGLPYEQNVAFVTRAVELAGDSGASVEAELGAIRGDEDVAKAVAAGALTEPAQARSFVERTGVQCLAVSIGNVHGTYLHPPSLDLERLQEISRATSVPLSLHGASGIPDAMVRDAIARGVSKINVNTELRGAYLEATKAQMPQLLSGLQVAALHRAQVAAVERVVEHKLQVYDIGVRLGKWAASA
jgi:ketose-bisphosphate aldolase